MHTATDSVTRAGYITRLFRSCASILLYAHQTRCDLRGTHRDAFGVKRSLGSEYTERNIRCDLSCDAII